MATAREIRRRIQSIHNLAQVTRALQAVAASKVRKAQTQAEATRPYAGRALEVMRNLAAEAIRRGFQHPLLARRERVSSILVVLFSADRGLCGPYNHNVVQAARASVQVLGFPARYITVGRRGRDLLWRLGEQIVADFDSQAVVPSIEAVRPIVRIAIDEFLAGKADEVYLAFTDFVNLLVQRPAFLRVLPLHPTEVAREAPGPYFVDVRPVEVVEYIFEPAPATILNAVLPRFTELQVYHALLEAVASEHAARMVAMQNATDNAIELVEDLTLEYNKARQQSITRELLDIAGGAEALAQARVM